MIATRNLSLIELRRLLAQNERAVGVNAQSTTLLRRLVAKREKNAERESQEGAADAS